MEAKDTVMSFDEASWAYEDARQNYCTLQKELDEKVSPVEADKAGINGHSLAQAEISFKAGIGEGLWMYAWWKDGVQYVGTTGTTLKEALKELRLDTG